MSGFRRATKQQSRLRMALAGPSGSGKTYTALTLATHLAQDGPIALVDTERGSASKYADLFTFDVQELVSFHPQKYIDAINEASGAGYPVLIIDSLSHAWMGKDGALELVDRAAKRSQSQNNFAAWREVTPLHNQLVDAMLGCACHLIVTLRSKQEYIQTVDERGKTIIKKVGLQPVQREGLEYEFDVYADMDNATMVVHKSRCPAMNDLVQQHPGREVGEILLTWLGSGAPPSAPPAPAPTSHPDRNGSEASQVPEDPSRVPEWFNARTAAMPQLRWTDETQVARAKALAIALKQRGMSDKDRASLYEILTGQRSGKDMDPRDLAVLQECVGQAERLLAVVRWAEGIAAAGPVPPEFAG